jgi:hypothetical protein
MLKKYAHILLLDSNLAEMCVPALTFFLITCFSYPLYFPKLPSVLAVS